MNRPRKPIYLDENTMALRVGDNDYTPPHEEVALRMPRRCPECEKFFDSIWRLYSCESHIQNDLQEIPGPIRLEKKIESHKEADPGDASPHKNDRDR